MMRLYNKLSKMKSSVPIGKKGNWKVEKFAINKRDADFFNPRQAINARGREVEVGNYTKLTYQNSVIMSDTPAELQDQIQFICNVYGNILVNGLGLGLVVEGLMLNIMVRQVTVIEIASEVITLVGKHLAKLYGDKITIINADAFTWQPPRGRRVYDFAWHDIWDSICGDYWPQVKKLKRKYSQKATLQEAWCEEQIKRAGK